MVFIEDSSSQFPSVLKPCGACVGKQFLCETFVFPHPESETLGCCYQSSQKKLVNEIKQKFNTLGLCKCLRNKCIMNEVAAYRQRKSGETLMDD